jgi:hypothetical protein
MQLDIMIWWQALRGAEQVFLGIGAVSNILFALYIGIQMFGHDTDLNTHADFDHGDLGFTVLSVRSILAFGMFLGYAGLVALQAGLGPIGAVVFGALAGLLAAWLAHKLFVLLLKLQSSGTLKLENAVGAVGKVHLPLPANAATPGKVMVIIQGALREMEAVSEGEALPTGTAILVTEVLENGQLVVIPYTE